MIGGFNDVQKDINDYYVESSSVDGLSDSQKKEYLSRDDIYAVGKNIAVSKAEVQQYTDFYLKDGKDKDNAQELARKDAMERNALYVAEIQNGYDVTSENGNSDADAFSELKERLADEQDFELADL